MPPIFYEMKNAVVGIAAYHQTNAIAEVVINEMHKAESRSLNDADTQDKRSREGVW